MRVSRRAVLAGMLAGVASPAAAQSRRISAAAGIDIQAKPIDGFRIGDRARRRFGALTFRGGLELRADHPAFGGFSGLWRSPDGTRLVALTDNAAWLTASVRVAQDGRPLGIGDARLAPVLGASGRPLIRSNLFDTEGLAMADGQAYVCVERAHQVLRFDFGRQGVAARAQAVPTPAAMRALPRNQGLEAIAISPRNGPLGGGIVTIAERSERAGDFTRGWIVTGPRTGTFTLVRSADFDTTDMAVLPGGDYLVLERRFGWLRGLSVRIRRIAGETLLPGARVDGPVLFEADLASEIDNFEGISVHRGAAGETLLTLISDDNFSNLQRTLLVVFALEP